MANTSAIWQQAAHNVYLLVSPCCSTKAIQKKKKIKEEEEDKKSTSTTRLKNKRGDRNGKSNDSPEISDTM